MRCFKVNLHVCTIMGAMVSGGPLTTVVDDPHNDPYIFPRPIAITITRPPECKVFTSPTTFTGKYSAQFHPRCSQMTGTTASGAAPPCHYHVSHPSHSRPSTNSVLNAQPHVHF